MKKTELQHKPTSVCTTRSSCNEIQRITFLMSNRSAYFNTNMKIAEEEFVDLKRMYNVFF